LLQDENDKNIFFTYSIWENDEALQAYRNSELFETTWAKTKILFAGKPEAWSTRAQWTKL
jgi:quinol monooxygenase YgiN